MSNPAQMNRQDIPFILGVVLQKTSQELEEEIASSRKKIKSSDFYEDIVNIFNENFENDPNKIKEGFH